MTRRPAAVVIAILRDSPARIIFVERAAHLRDHPGQIGLPGGGVHAEDVDLAATALRELHEEVGIQPHRVSILTQLETISQVVNTFDVTPFVAIVEPGDLRIDGTETAGVFTVPLATILGPELREGYVDFAGVRIVSPMLDYGEHRIWGLTARILQLFVHEWQLGGLRAAVEAALMPNDG